MPAAENNFCDVCQVRVAVYVEKKRRPGRLTRDQVCATCLRSHALQHHGDKLLPTGQYKKITY